MCTYYVLKLAEETISSMQLTDVSAEIIGSLLRC